MVLLRFIVVQTHYLSKQLHEWILTAYKQTRHIDSSPVLEHIYFCHFFYINQNVCTSFFRYQWEMIRALNQIWEPCLVALALKPAMEDHIISGPLAIGIQLWMKNCCFSWKGALSNPFFQMRKSKFGKLWFLQTILADRSRPIDPRRHPMDHKTQLLQGGTMGNWTSNLQLRSQMPKPLSYPAVLHKLCF